MATYNYGDNEVSGTAATGWRMAIRQLYLDGKLSDEDYKKYSLKYSIVLTTKENSHKSWWEKIYAWNKLQDNDTNENGRFVVVEAHGPEFDSDEDEDNE